MKQLPTISFQQVSKSFFLNRKPSLRWRLSHIGSIKNKPVEIIKDVSFDIYAGETVGLFGPNGSGKSTILRLAANIIKPTSGTISVRGNIAPVIELGSGLHPELTGRENIMLYASILGLSRGYVDRHINKIISFSELHEFIDIPIKKYSSGMKSRLAFSVAIFSDANVLLFDEIFAVGDTSFREKSIRLLHQMKKSRTILLTSHELSLMQQVCDRIFILDQGVLVNEENDALIALIQQMPQDYTYIAEATSNSMFPLIKSGDYVTAKKIAFNRITAGDIIVFHLPNLPEIIVHRVVDVIHEQKEKICITKGDSVFGLDVWKIHKENYLGKIIKIGKKHL